MVNGAAAVLEPTFTGYVATTQDALILFEACLTGVLHHVPRRPHDRERSHLVRSGSVFIYEENSSGIKRWTDGVTWSPSRILGNFLVYRELEKPFPPGEKKRAMKKANRRPVPSTRPGEPYPRQEATPSAYSPSSTASGPYGDRSHQSEVERALVGSLVDSYGFKDSGLVKKTMSVTVSGVTHHLVSYYSVEDVMRGALNPPSMVESLRYIRPRAELTQKQSFRAPIDDLETAGMENPNDPAHAIYGYRPQLVAPPGYAMPNPHPEFYLHASPYAATHPRSLRRFPDTPWQLRFQASKLPIPISQPLLLRHRFLRSRTSPRTSERRTEASIPSATTLCPRRSLPPSTPPSPARSVTVTGPTRITARRLTATRRFPRAALQPMPHPPWTRPLRLHSREAVSVWPHHWMERRTHRWSSVVFQPPLIPASLAENPTRFPPPTTPGTTDTRTTWEPRPQEPMSPTQELSLCRHGQRPLRLSHKYKQPRFLCSFFILERAAIWGIDFEPVLSMIAGLKMLLDKMVMAFLCFC
ncbi:hypothetical protein AWENTII_000439 [Aspergillus wentii]